jgi:hypothetical protein
MCHEACLPTAVQVARDWGVAGSGAREIAKCGLIEGDVFRRVVAAVARPEFNLVDGGGCRDQRVSQLDAVAPGMTRFS